MTMCELINLQSAPQYLQQSTKSAMSATHKFTLKKLRPELVHMRSTTKVNGQSLRGLSKESPSIKEDGMIFGENYSTTNEKISVGRKRKSPEVGEQPNKLDIRMNLSRKRQCATVLIKLMNHAFGWVFNEPVDPVKLRIPDYFLIITKPMDLGTIKRKLEKQHYSTTCMFAADVRLTFSNAMRYNPPDNFAHGYAKGLSKIFDSSWKVLESKWRKECLVTSKSAGVTKTFSQSSTKDAHKGIGRARLKSGCVYEKSSNSNSPHVSTENHNCEHNDFTQAPTSEAYLDSESSSGRENLVRHSNTSNLGCKKTVATQSGYSSPESGPATFNRENAHPTRHSSLGLSPRKDEDDPPYIDEDDPPCIELSPARALRAAMLKRRFSDTILKAQQKRLLDQGEKSDPIRMQREKEKLEKKQQEDWSKTDRCSGEERKEMARIEEVKAAAQRKAEIEMKKQQEKERVAARMLLEQMERTVYIEENSKILKDLENLGCLQPLYTLEQLGLIMKDDLDEDVEEGEFCIDY